MADTRENIILQVGLDGGKVSKDLADISRQLANVKKNQQDLNQQYKNGEITLSQYTAQTAALKDEQSWLQKEQKGLIATQKLLTETTDTYSDSLNGERQKLADMQKAYDQLDADMRKGEGGKAFLEAIQKQTEVVKGLEEETGRFQRNVGNYQSAFGGTAEKAKLLNEAFKQTTAGSSSLGKGIDTIDKTAKVFTKNPLFALLGLLAPLLAKIAGLTGQNKALTEAVNKVIKPLGDALKWIADLISNTLVAALNALASAWNSVKGFFGTIASWFTGGTSAVQSNTRAEIEAARAAKEYADQIENLEKQLAKEQKQLKQLRADNKYHIDMLKARGAAEKEIYEAEKKAREDEIQQILEINKTAAEELNALKEKLRKEGKVAREDESNFVVNFGGKEYEEFLAEYNRLADLIKNSYEDRKEKQREYDIWLAEEDTKRLKKQEADAAEERAALIDRLEDERKIRQTFADLQLADLERQAQDAQEKVQQLIKTGREALEAFREEEEETEDIPTPDEMARNLFGLDAEGVEYFQSLLEEGVSFAQAKTKALEDQTRRMAGALAKSFGDLGGSLQDMGDSIGYLTEENETAAKAQKAFALSGILLNQAQSISEGALAIAKGVESAAGIPFPANIPAIMSITAQVGAMIAGVMSSIDQAKQIFAQSDTGNFADGGTIDGTSYTGDRLIAHVNSGEGIYTGKQANNLLQEIANNPLRGGADMDAMTAAFTAAVAALPAPKMVYSEFNDFTQEVATYNELAAI